MQKVMSPGYTWEMQEKNAFLMERDTAIELGGYPEEFINLIIPSSDLSEISSLKPGIYCIGDPDILKKEKHVSFGKIVVLETKELEDDEIYPFTQEALMTDGRIRMKDVMLRQSPTHYNLNLRVGKKAVQAGFSLEVMGETIYQAFTGMEQVKAAVVILILGESPLYKELLEVAEKVKELTLTLNHIFDGIEMDCGRCEQSEICNEVEGMRQMHLRKVKQ